MSKIKWDENLSVGVKLIDEQHKTWIEHLNNAQAAIAARRGMEQVAGTLDFLADYTLFHFSTEEKYMSQTGYPDMANHKARHEEMKGTLEDLIRDFREEGVTEKISEAVGTFLGNWLKDHIRDVDQAFAAHLKEKKVQLS